MSHITFICWNLNFQNFYLTRSLIWIRGNWRRKITSQKFHLIWYVAVCNENKNWKLYLYRYIYIYTDTTYVKYFIKIISRLTYQIWFSAQTDFCYWKVIYESMCVFHWRQSLNKNIVHLGILNLVCYSETFVM